MGKKKNKKPSLFHQFKMMLDKQFIPGTSKHQIKQQAIKEAKKQGLKGKEVWNRMNKAIFDAPIVSYKTYENYLDVARLFSKYCKEKGAGKDASKARELADDFLRDKINQNCSAWTIKKYKAALRKLFRDNTIGNDIQIKREIKNIKRSRIRTSIDDYISRNKENNMFIISRAFGLRRSELKKITPSNFIIEENTIKLIVLKSKGGKTRITECLKDYVNAVKNILTNTTEKTSKIFEKVSSSLDLHALRRYYAVKKYKEKELTYLQNILRVQSVSGGYGQSSSNLSGNYSEHDIFDFLNRLIVDEERLEHKHDLEKHKSFKDFLKERDIDYYQTREGHVFIREVALEVSRELGHERLDVCISHYLK